MTPNAQYITIDNNLDRVKQFLKEIIVEPKKLLKNWSAITNQTPAAKIGYVGQHLTSLITGVKGTGSGARGDDLADGSEVKSCNKVDQVDKCKSCGARVFRYETKCSNCDSDKIDRKDDSKWLFSVRDEHELRQYLNMDRIILLLMDYPKFEENDFNDIRVSVFEIYPKDSRMSVFGELIRNHYYNIYIPKINDNNNDNKANPMNLHPFSFQFYKCNPIQIFECIIQNADSDDAEIYINEDIYIEPRRTRDATINPAPMPSSLIKKTEWQELLDKANFETEIRPLLIEDISLSTFTNLSDKNKTKYLPYLDERLRNYISLRPIISNRQRQHYQR